MSFYSSQNFKNVFKHLKLKNKKNCLHPIKMENKLTSRALKIYKTYSCKKRFKTYKIVKLYIVLNIRTDLNIFV